MNGPHQQIKDRNQVLHINGHVGAQGHQLAERVSILRNEEEPLNLCATRTRWM